MPRVTVPVLGYYDQSHCTSPRKPWPVLGYRDQTIVPVLGYRDQSTVPVLGYRDQSIVPVLGYRYQALYQSQDTETTRILWPESLYQSQDTVIKPLYQSKRLFNFYFVVVVTNAIFAWQKWSRKLSYSNPSVPSPPPSPFSPAPELRNLIPPQPVTVNCHLVPFCLTEGVRAAPRCYRITLGVFCCCYCWFFLLPIEIGYANSVFFDMFPGIQCKNGFQWWIHDVYFK